MNFNKAKEQAKYFVFIWGFIKLISLIVPIFQLIRGEQSFIVQALYAMMLVIIVALVALCLVDDNLSNP